MNRTIFWALALLLSACGQPSQAELQLDAKIKPQKVEAMLEPLFESVVRPYGDQRSVNFGGIYGKNGTFPNFPDSNFAWLFNGTSLLSNIGAYTPQIEPLKDCEPDPENTLNANSHCDWRRKGFNVCHLFMFNGQSLKLENVTRLNIVRDKKQLLGLPRCNGVEAMAAAKTIPDSMLITLRYSDSAEPADPRNDPPRFYSTVLLRFSEDHGKLRIVQDDSCLGNPNKIRTIAAARKVLSNCSSNKKTNTN